MSSSAVTTAPVTVYISDKVKNAKANFPSNYIRTTKYTLLTFVFLNLYEQYQKMSIIFFTLNMVLSLIPGVSPVLPITTIAPLVCVVAVAAVRDALEDHTRYKSDQKANSTPVTVVRNGKRMSIKSMDVQAGDICRIARDDQILCDCVLISSSIEDGTAFVETAQLDGETNLKPKLCKKALHDYFGCDEAKMGAQLQGSITVDAPNNNLNKCEGKVAVDAGDKLGIPVQPIGNDNVLLRGCLIQNCDFVYAVAVYTGVNTKLFLNLKKTKPKMSRLDIKLNKIIILIFLIQQVLILLLCSASVLFRSEYLEKFFRGPGVVHTPMLTYMIDSDTSTYFFSAYATYFVLLAVMIPISLFVSMEFCKTAQAKFMEWDTQMQTPVAQMKARTSSLNEELSQVQYIFTDKTGTLTENRMEFAKCWCACNAYDEQKAPGGLLRKIRDSDDPKEVADLTLFLQMLTMSNDVVISVKENGDLHYDGSSTDEVALVTCAGWNRFVLKGRTSDSITFMSGVGPNTTTPTTWGIECVLPFSADRKMMSVILRDRTTNRIVCTTKGADSSIIENLDRENARNKALLLSAQNTLRDFAKEGLRTLAFGYKDLTESELQAFLKTWNEATVAMTDRARLVEEVCLSMERGLTLAGCTAIEDKLQDEVPETIKFFLDAGLVVWVLTGDKRETAINIAGTSKLLNPRKDTLVILDHTEVPQGRTITDSLRDGIEQAHFAKEHHKKVSVIIDGATIRAMEATPGAPEVFEELAHLVNSAVCCRVTPLQKANVVAMFQKHGYTCLGIGDGANDVSMIQEAKVGIGVIGLEGSQAERASDYAIPRFRHLRRLLAVHGRYSLIRNSKLIQYSFYKNLIYCVTQFFFAFDNGFSGQTLYDSWVIVCYNMIFTLLPPLAMGLFEFDIRDDILLKHPRLYGELRNPYAVRLSRVSASMWSLLSLMQGMIIYFGGKPLMTYSESDMWSEGTVLLTVVIVLVLLQACVVYMSWTLFHLLSILFSLAGYLLFVFLYAMYGPMFGFYSYYWIPNKVFQEPTMYLYLTLWGIGLIGPEIAFLFIRRYYFGTLAHHARREYAQEQAMTSVWGWMAQVVQQRGGFRTYESEEEMLSPRTSSSSSVCQTPTFAPTTSSSNNCNSIMWNHSNSSNNESAVYEFSFEVIGSEFEIHMME
eukprot:PhM_4_TR7614/c0_g1_i2/m.4553/K14802/DRS2, ATP8A; phospholipid-transporting ATPase